jgi:hypothetical protein
MADERPPRTLLSAEACAEIDKVLGHPEFDPGLRECRLSSGTHLSSGQCAAICATASSCVDRNYVGCIYLSGGRFVSGFVGRNVALSRMRFDRTVQTQSGVAVAIRGRRQVRKSRLVQEFCDVAGVPYFYFTATTRPGCVGTRPRWWRCAPVPG